MIKTPLMQSFPGWIHLKAPVGQHFRTLQPVALGLPINQPEAITTLLSLSIWESLDSPKTETPGVVCC